MKKLAHEYAMAHPDEQWVWGSYGFVTPPGRQARALLDEAFPDRPVSLLSGDGHNLWVNSKALAAAGIKRDTPNPSGTARGTIVREAGEATGILEEGAKSLVLRVMPVNDDEKLRRFKLGMDFAIQHGITSIINATGDLAEMKLYDTMRGRGELTVRTTTAFADDVGIRHTLTRRTGRFRKGARAVSRRLDPGRGHQIFCRRRNRDALRRNAGAVHRIRLEKGSHFVRRRREFQKFVLELDRLGFQVMTHAIGDGAVRMTLDAYEAVQKQNGPRDRRWRIEHMEAVAPSDWPRFGKLGIIAAFQPWCCPSLKEGQGKSLGPDRLKESMPWQSIASGGATISLGSDWPVESLDPVPHHPDCAYPPGFRQREAFLPTSRI